MAAAAGDGVVAGRTGPAPVAREPGRSSPMADFVEPQRSSTRRRIAIPATLHRVHGERRLAPTLRSWAGAPSGTAASSSLVVDDPDASGLVHWIVL